MKIRMLTTTMFLLGGAMAPALAANSVLQSAASVAVGSLSVDGAVLPIGPVAGISGNTAKGQYDVVASVPAVSQSFFGSSAKSPGVIVSVNGVMEQAKGVSGSAGYAAASVDVGAVSISLVPPASVGTTPYLSLAVDQASGASAYTLTASATGQTVLGTIAISGSLLPAPVNVPINAAPNTVVFQNDYLKITANAVRSITPTGCAKSCASVPLGVETDGVLVEITNLSLNGESISGTYSIVRTSSN